MGTPVSDRVIMLYILFYTYFGREAYIVNYWHKRKPAPAPKLELELELKPELELAPEPKQGFKPTFAHLRA